MIDKILYIMLWVAEIFGILTLIFAVVYLAIFYGS